LKRWQRIPLRQQEHDSQRGAGQQREILRASLIAAGQGQWHDSMIRERAMPA